MPLRVLLSRVTLSGLTMTLLAGPSRVALRATLLRALSSLVSMGSSPIASRAALASNGSVSIWPATFISPVRPVTVALPVVRVPAASSSRSVTWARSSSRFTSSFCSRCTLTGLVVMPAMSASRAIGSSTKWLLSRSAARVVSRFRSTRMSL